MLGMMRALGMERDGDEDDRFRELEMGIDHAPSRENLDNGLVEVRHVEVEKGFSVPYSVITPKGRDFVRQVLSDGELPREEGSVI